LNNTNTIESVVKAGLCTGCGTCAGICPLNAIEMAVDNARGIYVPILDKEKCNECGICLDTCPGHTVDFKQLNLDIWGREPEDVLLGNYLNCYIGHARDYDIRYNAASGGLVTALLIFALEEGLINGALVTRMRQNRPLEPEPFLARTKEEIISAARSKYCPVPANIALREILKSKGEERFAVVGLPCHIHGIRKAEAVNKKLREKIVLHLGIVCAHTDSFLLTDFILQKCRVMKENVVKLDYRGQGWPGSMRIQLQDGTVKFVPFWQCMLWHGLGLSVPECCQSCSDALAELADISFGDAWLRDLASDKAGKSIIISRNEPGEQLLRSLISRGGAELNEINVKRLVQSQKGSLYVKKKIFIARAKISRRNLSGQEPVLAPDILDHLYAIYQYLNCLIISKSPLARFLRYVPVSIMRLFKLPLDAIPIIQMNRLIRKHY
jgi:coenzyme F420 hydrogenase subunit beta